MSPVLARCPKCHKPVARVVRNAADIQAETEEQDSIEAAVVTFDLVRGAVREVGVWVPLYGLREDSGAISVRCTTCSHSSRLNPADLIRRRTNPDTPPRFTGR